MPLIIVLQMISEKENWITVADKSEYQYPGVYKSERFQCVYHYKTLEQSAESDPHFIWNDIRLCIIKRKLKEDRLLEMNLGGKKEMIHY